VQAILAARIDRLAAAKALLQAAAVIGKEVPEPALSIVSGLDDEALAEGLKELIGAGFLYEAEIYPERVLAFSHPLTREVAYGSQLGEQRAAAHAGAARALIELNSDRHDELAALIAQHLEQGGEALEAARWNARAAHWAGYSHPRDAMRLWGRVTELASELPESEETSALGVYSRLLQLDYAWRLGMEKERVDALVAEAREIATKTGDLRSLTLLKLLESARPGLVQHADEWTRASHEAVALADESGDDALRVAIRTAGSYAYLVAGDFDRCEELLDQALGIAADDHSAGNGIVIGCPYAWATMAKAVIRRDRCEFEAGEELSQKALRIADEQGDLETASWTRGNLAVQLAAQGNLDEALGLAQRNYELTERLGDVFSRQWALVNLGYVRLERGDAEGALAVLERADRLYREAMGDGGESEAWREAMIAEALLGVGRVAEALQKADYAAEVARDRGLFWPLPRALRTLARAKLAAGEPGAGELLDQAEQVAMSTGRAIELIWIERVRAAASTSRA
jgi:adenylate cyclase